MKKHLFSLHCITLLAPALLALPSHAQPTPNTATGAYLQYGSPELGTGAWTAGVILPWKNWSYALGSGLLTGYWDLSTGHWSSRNHNRDLSTWVVGAKPTLRWRPTQGHSPWFIEAGLGMSYAINHRYMAENKEFSTRYNFATHLGIGYLFGEQLKNELSVRLEHHSNASIKTPNPGENFLQIRYARYF